MRARRILSITIIPCVLAFAALLSIEFLTSFTHVQALQQTLVEKLETRNIYQQFVGEVYDLIKNNYWDNITDDRLSALFVLGSQQLGHSTTTSTPDKKGVEQMVGKIIKDLDKEKKREFVLRLCDSVLTSLTPNGRSRLYNAQLKQQLINTVSNVDVNTDLYKTLGVSQDATQDEVKKSYSQKVDELQKEDQKKPAVKQELEDVKRAYEALATPDRRQAYDKYKVEPTVAVRFIKPGILYFPIKRISPQTYDELQKSIDSVPQNQQGDALILDLRDNIGGSVDLLPQLLGPFIGKDQYAYEFFHKSERVPHKTTTGWLAGLVPYKNIVILIDGQSQSSAEVMATTLKKYNVGVLVGTKTKGWGTVEGIFDLKTPLDENQKFSAILVHSLTLREDGLPIEGRGVDPTIDITQPNWDKQLFAYFHRQDLVDAVKQLVAK